MQFGVIEVLILIKWKLPKQGCDDSEINFFNLMIHFSNKIKSLYLNCEKDENKQKYAGIGQYLKILTKL